MRKGFTLAEILIALGVIGIVMVLTIPQIIANHKKKVTVARLKQAYAIVKQAYTLAEAEYGSIDNWEEFNVARSTHTDSATTETAVKKYLAPYVNAIRCDSSGSYRTKPIKQLNSNYYASLVEPMRVMLKNGMFIEVNTIYNDSDNFVWMQLFIDLDGEKGPHELGKDVFVMAYYRHLNNRVNIYLRKSNNGAYFIGEGNTVEHIKTMNMYGCQNGIANRPHNGASCGAWIMQNSWEFPDNYPWH